MSDVFDREQPDSEHALDSLLTPATRRVVLVLYALLLLFLGVWLLFSSEPAAAPLTRPSLRIGVLGGPEADVLELVQARHPELGLELVRFERPELVNDALTRGEIQAASFQDGPSFQAEVQERRLPLAQAALTVTLPLGFYSQSLTRLDALTPGSKVVLSAEPRAQSRALLVLYHFGLIEFTRPPNTELRIADIAKNPRGIVFETAPRHELRAKLNRDASLVALEYADAAAAGLSPARRALALEDAFSPFANVLAVHERNLDPAAPWLRGLLEAYREREVKALILKRFEDSVRRPW